MRFQGILAVFVAGAFVACTGGPSVDSGSGEGGDTATTGATNDREGTPKSGGEASSETSGSDESSPNEGTSSPGSSSSSSGGSSSGGSSSSGSSSSGSSGSSAPRPECVAFANRHCACLEAANAAAADCRTKVAKGCEDGVSLCPGQLAWYTCSQTTCGNTCPQPEC